MSDLFGMALTETEAGADLVHYAAHAAAKELVENWRAAKAAGSSRAMLWDIVVTDTRDTIAALRTFQTMALRELSEDATSPARGEAFQTRKATLLAMASSRRSESSISPSRIIWLALSIHARPPKPRSRVNNLHLTLLRRYA